MSMTLLLLFSDRLRKLSRHEYRQNCCSVANASRNRHQGFGYRGVLFRKSLKTSADVVELIDLIQNSFKSHGYTALR